MKLKRTADKNPPVKRTLKIGFQQDARACEVPPAVCLKARHLTRSRFTCLRWDPAKKKDRGWLPPE